LVQWRPGGVFMNQQSNSSFTTSFGNTIDFVPGYLDYIESVVGLPKKASDDYVHASINAAGGHQNLDYEAVNQRLKQERKGLTLSGYAARLARVYQFLDLLGNTRLEPRFEKHLDIGCGYGFQPRIMRALGVVGETTGIDVYDRCSAVDEANLKKQHRQLRWLKALEPIRRRAEKVPVELRSDLRRAVLEKGLDPLSPRHRYKNQVGWMPDLDFYNLKFKTEPKLDRFIQGDVFELKEKFNLITTFTSFEWFEARTILPKVSEMLEDGGVFYIWVSNWWSDTNVTRLSGHFPFACQRMNKDDYFRYLDECLPDHAEAMKGAYEWFDPSHPTLADYTEIGYENGLIALDYREYNRPDSFGTHSGISPLGHLDLDGGVLHRVLEEIQQFRPDVRLTDLLPFSHGILFQKVDKKTKLDAEGVARITKPVNFQYQPQNPIMKKMKEIAVKLHPIHRKP
jgi:SAM-dependent methyltransferase